MSKFKKALKDNKKYIILFLVLWVVLEIVLIAPIAVSIKESTTEQGMFDLSLFIENFGKEISSFTAITKLGSTNAIGTFGKGTIWLTIIFFVFTVVGIIKSKPKIPFSVFALIVLSPGDICAVIIKILLNYNIKSCNKHPLYNILYCTDSQ